MGLPSHAGAVAGYGDVSEGTWYTDAVQWSTDNGIVDIAGFCFAPETPVSRGETAVWIYHMENRPDTGDLHSFTDVTDAAQNDAISWMANTEITTGTSPTTFAPDETLTRAQAATFLHRLAGEPAAPPHNFSDVVTAWQQGGVSWMVQTGITTGTSPTTFAPEDTLTRAHLVTFLYRYQDEPEVTINTSTPNCDPTTDMTNRAPRFTSMATLAAPENTTAVGTVIAIDDDLADTVTGYALTGGADRSRLSITSAGRLGFNTAPDYERPADTDQDNNYEIIVTATSGTGTRVMTATQSITVTITATTSTTAPDDTDSSEADITVGVRVPPAELGFDPFYEKYLDLEGLPIIASARVPDEALLQARLLIGEMLTNRRDVLATLAANNVRVAIMAEGSGITEIPEFNDLYEAFPGVDWDNRTRGGGVGPTFARPVLAIAEENLLCYRTDLFPYEDIAVHEAAHAVLNMGIEPQPGGVAFRQRLERAYRDALDAGLWLHTYAAQNVDEYWAEGVQSWFDVNDPPGFIHNEINTRTELEGYDPALAALISEMLGEVTVSSCHSAASHPPTTIRILGTVPRPWRSGSPANNLTGTDN